MRRRRSVRTPPFSSASARCSTSSSARPTPSSTRASSTSPFPSPPPPRSTRSSSRIVENDLYKEDWRSRKKVQIFQYIILKWTIALLIGLATGLVGFFNNIAVENIAGFKLLLTSNLMLKDRYREAFVVYAACNLILAAAAAALCAYIAPAAAGSGIPEVKAYLNGVDA